MQELPMNEILLKSINCRVRTNFLLRWEQFIWHYLVKASVDYEARDCPRPGCRKKTCFWYEANSNATKAAGLHLNTSTASFSPSTQQAFTLSAMLSTCCQGVYLESAHASHPCSSHLALTILHLPFPLRPRDNAFPRGSGFEYCVSYAIRLASTPTKSQGF